MKKYDDPFGSDKIISDENPTPKFTSLCTPERAVWFDPEIFRNDLTGSGKFEFDVSGLALNRAVLFRDGRPIELTGRTKKSFEA